MFYFDIEDGDYRSRDEVGGDFADASAARDEALGALRDIARHSSSVEDHSLIVVNVIDEYGLPVLSASLSLAVEWV